MARPLDSNKSQIQACRHQARHPRQGPPREALFVVLALRVLSAFTDRLLDEDLKEKPFFPGLIECTFT